MAGTRGSTNGSGAGTRTARGAAEGRVATGGRAHAASSAYGRLARRTLTIGEAAAALSGEFPGVTAAVLRRLEAAGQFIPARSSSGYRRYSEADLDLIRLVLTNEPAQLPDQEQAGRPASGAERATWSGSPDPADLSGAEHPLTHPAAGHSEAENALAAVGVARDLTSGAAHHGGHPGPQGPAAGRTTARSGRAASSRVPAARSAGVDDPQGTASRHQGALRPTTEALFDVPPKGAAHPSQRPELTGAEAAPGAVPGNAPTDAARRAAVPGASAANAAQLNGAALRGTTLSGTALSGTARSTTASTNGTTSTGTTPNGAAPSTAASRRAERRWPDPEFFAPDLGEVALDRDQLAAAARTDRAWVDGLVEYGLLSGNRSAGGADLLVARAAAELAQFGMEPRHLRAVAASAARVAELIASATSPGPARDAARRERTLLAAPGRSAEAAAAAVRLHAALVRAALLRG
ncbi:MAG TPA: MerR family transcriptional regulator [Actinocrinis sp.]|nr:MerR family transcriptional regulator [Actinocrinis sp.]